MNKNHTIVYSDDRNSKVIMLKIPSMECDYLKRCYEESKRNWEEK